MIAAGPLLPLLGAMAILFVAGSLFLLRATEKQTRVRARLHRVANPQLTEYEPPKAEAANPLDLVAKLGGALARSGLLPAATRAEFEQTLMQAGWRGSRGLGVFVGSKMLLMVGLPAIAYALVGQSGMAPTTRYAIIGMAFAAGMLAPDFILKQMRQRHLKAVERGLPDALDMMVICAQAGLALETAIDRVAEEFVAANAAVATELAICASEMRMGTDRRQALLQLGSRTGLENMRRLAATLIQTMQFGTPLTHALRVLAAEMRSDNLTKFEERAARLPVILTFPMILFILPTVFIVVGGPAGIRIVKIFAHH